MKSINELFNDFENIVRETERYECKCEEYGIDNAIDEMEELKSTFSLHSSTYDDIIEEIEDKKLEIKRKIIETI